MNEKKYGIPSLKREFPTEEACLAYIFDTLHTRECSCGGEYSPITGRKQYQCSKCRFQIAPTAGTIFEKSSTPLTLWFHAILVFSNAKSGISAKQMQRELEVTYKCAWRILSRIRKALKQSDDLLKGSVEMDSAYIGGVRNAGKNNENLKEAVAAKSVITVAVERGGRIRAKATSDVTANSIEYFIRENIKNGSRLFTDNAKGYRRMAKDYDLSSVDHGKREYVRGEAHVNTIETWFAHLKRSLRGTFKSVSKRHLQSYLDAFAFHYNNRHSDRERFEALLGSVLKPAVWI